MTSRTRPKLDIAAILGRTAILGRVPRWWMAPHIFLLFVTLPVFAFIFIGAKSLITTSPALVSHAYFVRPVHIVMCIGAILVLSAFSFLGTRIAPNSKRVTVTRSGLDFLFGLTVAAYLIWFGPAFIGNPGMFVRVLFGETGAIYAVRHNAPNIAGVTTATQFGVSYLVMYLIGLTRGDPYPRRHRIFLIIILALALFRSVMFSERLAVIELLFPAFVIFLSRKSKHTSTAENALALSFPILLIFLGPVIFAAFEYFRSWSNLQINYDTNFATFVFNRFLLYYATAMNNAAGIMSAYSGPTYTGEVTFAWLYSFPVIGEILSSQVHLTGASDFTDFLRRAASPEFNNGTGVLPVFTEWGIEGAVPFFAAYGLVCGITARQFFKGRGIGQFLFPMVLYSLFELPRIGYLYDGRFAAIVIGVVLAVVLFSKRRAVRPAFASQRFRLRRTTIVEPIAGSQRHLGWVPNADNRPT